MAEPTPHADDPDPDAPTTVTPPAGAAPAEPVGDPPPAAKAHAPAGPPTPPRGTPPPGPVGPPPPGWRRGGPGPGWRRGRLLPLLLVGLVCLVIGCAGGAMGAAVLGAVVRHHDTGYDRHPGFRDDRRHGPMDHQRPVRPVRPTPQPSSS